MPPRYFQRRIGTRRDRPLTCDLGRSLPGFAAKSPFAKFNTAIRVFLFDGAAVAGVTRCSSPCYRRA